MEEDKANKGGLSDSQKRHLAWASFCALVKVRSIWIGSIVITSRERHCLDASTDGHLPALKQAGARFFRGKHQCCLSEASDLWDAS